MAKTSNYQWDLPSPTGIQITEIARIATTFSAIDVKFKSFETALATHEHAFNDLTGKPTTLGGYGITDGMTAQEVADAIKAATDALIGGSSAALDTLKELADALGNDPQFATAVGNALGVRVRVDAAQAFNIAQKSRGRANLDAVGTGDVGISVAPLGSDGKVPSGYLPALTTTATVGAAMAGANGKTTPADGDFFGGVEAGGSAMFKTTWGNIKTALSALFYTKTVSDGRFVSLDADQQPIPSRKVFNNGSAGGNIGANTTGAIEIQPSVGVNTDAYMSFHVPEARLRINFGFRPSAATPQDGLHIGGGSMGATAYMIYNTSHFGRSGNANGILAGGADYNIYSSAALLSAINNRVGTRVAPQNCSWSTGIMEFGSVDPGHNNETADLPSPWVMVGIRSASNSDRVYVRGATLKNTA